MKKEKVLNLFESYADDIFRFALSYVKSKQEAEDIVQDVFLKLLTKQIVFSVGKEKSYLMKMTANMCKNYLKSSRYITTADIDYDALNVVVSCKSDTNSEFLFDAIMKLDIGQRMPLYLHYYEGYSYSEIAKILKISNSSVAMRISRAKDNLRLFLEN